MIKNLTPHAVTIIAADGTVDRTIPSDGVARAAQMMKPGDGLPEAERPRRPDAGRVPAAGENAGVDG